jgi:hypothetical protein
MTASTHPINPQFIKFFIHLNLRECQKKKVICREDVLAFEIPYFLAKQDQLVILNGDLSPLN